MDEILLILFGIAWVVGTPILAIVALVRAGTARTENARLAAEVATLRRQVEQGVVAVAAAPPPPEPVTAPAPEAIPVLEAPPVPAESLPPPFEPDAPPPPVPVFDTAPTPVVAPVAAGWEQRLGARAFIWVVT